MKEELEQVKRELEQLKSWKASLERSSSIPLPIDQAFKERFINSIAVVTASSKSASSENKAVDEGGVATYSVLTTPDAFVQVLVGSTTYYLPAFT